jgi:hypothetical protein
MTDTHDPKNGDAISRSQAIEALQTFSDETSRLDDPRGMGYSPDYWQGLDTAIGILESLASLPVVPQDEPLQKQVEAYRWALTGNPYEREDIKSLAEMLQVKVEPETANFDVWQRIVDAIETEREYQRLSNTIVAELIAEIESLRGAPVVAPKENCPHLSHSGVDPFRALDDPQKVWRCDECGALFRGEPLAPVVAGELTREKLDELIVARVSLYERELINQRIPTDERLRMALTRYKLGMMDLRDAILESAPVEGWEEK